jgi:hypothetical protein
MTKPSTVLILKMAVRQSTREIFYFPLWWYSKGLGETLAKLLTSIHGSVRFFGVDVWSKNLFVPMYGDTSIVGRAISFGVRLVMVCVRSLGVMVWSVMALGLAILYVSILPLALIGLIVTLGRLLS